MSTELEKYLIEKRITLDVDVPDDKLIWDKIEERMAKDSRGKSLNLRKRSLPGISFSMLRKIAASVIIMLGLAYIADDIISDRKAYNTLSLGTIDPRYGEKETEYILNIEARVREVSLTETDRSPVIKELVKELQEQDKAYRQAISDLRVMGSNERVVNTIFSIYERKIRLLEMIIMETNKQERYEQKNESPV
jgi:hypothetical protein